MTLEETIQFINDPSLQMEDEIWKQHPIRTKYYASNFGRIRYFDRHGKEKIKIQSFDKQAGRFRFSIHTSIRQNGFKSARFICECFYGIHDDLQVDHINTIPYDNHIENLRFCTCKENNNNPISLKNKKKEGNDILFVLPNLLRKISLKLKCSPNWAAFFAFTGYLLEKH